MGVPKIVHKSLGVLLSYGKLLQVIYTNMLIEIFSPPRKKNTK